MAQKKKKTSKSKAVPTNPSLYARIKAKTKAKFDVYPSAYANMAASKYCKDPNYGKK